MSRGVNGDGAPMVGRRGVVKLMGLAPAAPSSVAWRGAGSGTDAEGDAGPLPLAVMIHGGGWSGFSTAASTGHMAADLERVTVTGVSAGGNLAAWAAGRSTLPPEVPGSLPKFPLRNCVAICGVYGLALAYRAGDKHNVPLLGVR